MNTQCWNLVSIVFVEHIKNRRKGIKNGSNCNFSWDYMSLMLMFEDKSSWWILFLLYYKHKMKKLIWIFIPSWLSQVLWLMLWLLLLLLLLMEVLVIKACFIYWETPSEMCILQFQWSYKETCYKLIWYPPNRKKKKEQPNAKEHPNASAFRNLPTTN